MGERKIYQQPRTGVVYEMEEFRHLARLSRGGYTVEVVTRDLLQWEMGKNAQEAFPYLSADQREFLISGLTPAEFAELFPDGDE